MFTTAALMRSLTSAKFTKAAAAGGSADRPRPFRLGLPVALDTTGVGVHSPARISPTRNVSADDSTSVMKVKRRDTGISQAPVGGG